MARRFRRPPPRGGFGGNGPRPILPGHGAPAPGGYGGLDDIIAKLQGGINQQQFNNMDAGHTGGNGWGGIGGMDGAFAGLSPYAVHYLTQSGMLQKQAAPQTSTEGLSGDELFRTTLMNSLAGQNANANPMYKLANGIDEGFLGQLFAQGFGGHSAYEKGYGAEGALPQQPKPFQPGRLHQMNRQGRPWQAMIRRNKQRSHGQGQGRGHTPGINPFPR